MTQTFHNLHQKKGKRLKIIALAEIKAGNNSESLLNEIRQILYINQKKLLKNYTLKNKICKHITSILKNVYIDKLDNIVNK